MQNPFQSNQSGLSWFPFSLTAARPLRFSDEIDAQRRRKGSGPEGRAEAPVYRGDGGGQGGGGWQPSSGGGGGSGIKLPWWMIIIIFILLLIFGGKGCIGQLLGGGSATSNPAEQSPLTGIDTSVPDVHIRASGRVYPSCQLQGRQLDGHALPGCG